MFLFPAVALKIIPLLSSFLQGNVFVWGFLLRRFSLCFNWILQKRERRFPFSELTCSRGRGPVGGRCQGRLIEGELIMPELSECGRLSRSAVCLLISNSSVWPGSGALLLSCHPLFVCAHTCDCVDAPSSLRRCVCSHGQQGASPLPSLAGIGALHLCLPSSLLIGFTPESPKNVSGSRPPFRGGAAAWSGVKTPTDATLRAAAQQGGQLLSCCSHSSHLTPAFSSHSDVLHLLASPPAFLFFFFAEQHLNQCPCLPICPLSC